MFYRVVWLLTLAASTVFGQAIFGPVTLHLKAGDFAPDLVFTKQLSGPAPASWTSSDFYGQTTFLALFPDTSHNLDSVQRWNALADQYSGRPVQFVWVTNEKEETLTQSLEQHPVKGWVFYDERGETGRAFGTEFPTGVVIGTDRKIAGFNQEIIPREETISAALEGRITNTRPTPAQIREYDAKRLVFLNPEPFREPDPNEHKPNFPPSYELHVTPSTKTEGGSYAGDGYLNLQSYDLKTLISEMYEINPIRLQLPKALDNGRKYDFAMVLPGPEDPEQIHQRVQKGIQEYFHVTGVRQNALADVYVVTAPAGGPAAFKRIKEEDDDEFDFVSTSSLDFETPAGADASFITEPALPLSSIRGIAMVGNVDEFCHRLESGVDRPVVNESGLEGRFEFNVQVPEGGPNDFLKRLRDQTGLEIVQAQRTIETLVFQPAN